VRARASDAISWLVVLIVALLCAGCEGGGTAGTGAADPRDVLRQMRHAVLKGDLASFRECYGGDAGYREVVDEAFAYLRAVDAFKDALEKRDGPDGFDAFADTDLTQTVAMVEDVRDEDVVEHRHILVRGNEAILTDPMGDNKPSMKRVGGRWVIWIEGTPSQLHQSAGIYHATTAALETSRKEVEAGSTDWRKMQQRIDRASGMSE
jgi:hypothetical protein